jgi:hypothetical protein
MNFSGLGESSGTYVSDYDLCHRRDCVLEHRNLISELDNNYMNILFLFLSHVKSLFQLIMM